MPDYVSREECARICSLSLSYQSGRSRENEGQVRVRREFVTAPDSESDAWG